MKIIWSEFSIRLLAEIYSYYKTKASTKVAKEIKSDIFSATKHLCNYPDSGQIEENLEHLNEGYRYVISRNYKIIYKKIPQGILIIDIFDSRQNPDKISDKKRKS